MVINLSFWLGEIVSELGSTPTVNCEYYFGERSWEKGVDIAYGRYKPRVIRKEEWVRFDTLRRNDEAYGLANRLEVS